MHDLKTTAARALACLDLTDLTDDCTPAAIDDLCARAVTPHGPVAAVCLWPAFVQQAKGLLAGTGVRVATVANFPAGADDPEGAARETAAAFAGGADEVDVVVPYRAALGGHPARVAAVVQACRAVTPDGRILKTILETGELEDPVMIGAVARMALAGGSDFLKTSTGKVAVNATPQAAEVLLTEIRGAGRAVGFKAAGGIRTTADAALYLAAADRIMGAGWAGPQTFRFGASGLLNDLLAVLDGQDGSAAGTGY